MVVDYMKELTDIAKTHGGIIEAKIAAQRGISKAMLYKLCKEDKIHRIVKGQYILPDDMQDELLAISNRSERIIFSHETALYLHGISDRTPFAHTVTAPSGCIPSAAIKAECKVYYIKPELFELGKTMLKTPAGNAVPAYDLERTICDIIRSRNKMGTETFLAALKLYAVNPRKDLNKLNTYAKKMRVSNVLRHYLEVLL
jgi:predicted transcriptional regulator of viral defense system